jgi:hypothetical protein
MLQRQQVDETEEMKRKRRLGLVDQNGRPTSLATSGLSALLDIGYRPGGVGMKLT